VDALTQAASSATSADDALVRRAQTGDAAAFEMLVDTRIDRCYRLAWSILSITNGISTTLIATPCTVLSPQFTRPHRRRYLGSLAVHQIVLSAIFVLIVALV